MNGIPTVPGGPKAPATWKNSLSKFTRISSVLCLVFLVTTSLWQGLSLDPPLIVNLVGILAFAFGPGLFLLNLALAVLVKGHRLRHVAFVSLLIAAGGFDLWTTGWHVEKRHRWFIQEGMGQYDQIVQKVMESRALLTAESQNLFKIARIPGLASAYTNADGSITIWFPGGEGGPRHGYIYHSGERLTTKPANPDEYFFRLTNGWYEY